MYNPAEEARDKTTAEKLKNRSVKQYKRCLRVISEEQVSDQKKSSLEQNLRERKGWRYEMPAGDRVGGKVVLAGGTASEKAQLGKLGCERHPPLTHKPALYIFTSIQVLELSPSPQICFFKNSWLINPHQAFLIHSHYIERRTKDQKKPNLISEFTFPTPVTHARVKMVSLAWPADVGHKEMQSRHNPEQLEADTEWQASPSLLPGVNQLPPYHNLARVSLGCQASRQRGSEKKWGANFVHYLTAHHGVHTLPFPPEKSTHFCLPVELMDF